ncbi:MAG: hypothetical protein IKT65_03020 [Clostridia bacterium]|nr:hypothetical protein [Clostridia bacterium]
MKKLLILILALALAVCPLVSCGNDSAAETSAQTGAYDVASAAAFLKNMYKQYLTAPETGRDFTLTSQVMNNGVAYTVTWTTNSDKVVVEPNEAEKQVTINVDEKTPEVVNYDLTATVASPSGETATVVFKLVIPAYTPSPVVTTVEEGKAYKFYIDQKLSKKIVYLDGGVSGRYLSTTTDGTKALDFFAEKSGDGFKFYATIDGAKMYIDTYLNDEGKQSVKYAASTECVYKYNAETYAWEVKVGDSMYYLGTYSTYDTVSASATSYISADNTRVSQFPMELVYEVVEVAPDAGNEDNKDDDNKNENNTTVKAEVVSAPEAEKAYKFYLNQAEASKILYLDGGVSGDRYLTMTDDYSKALDFYVEAAEGGFKFFTNKDGAKKYLDLYINADGKQALQYADASTVVYSYNAATFAWEATVDGTAYYLGTYGTFETVSASKTSYISAENTRVSQFPMEIVTGEVKSSTEEGGSTAPTVQVVSAPAADTAYNFYYYQGKVGKTLYIDGGIDDAKGRYFTTTEDASKALKVYAEAVEGGFKFYTTINNAKQYLNMYLNGEEKISLGYADATDAVFAYDSTTFAWKTTVGGTEYYMGTYNTFETVSASATSYINAENTRVSQFPLELIAIA